MKMKYFFMIVNLQVNYLKNVILSFENLPKEVATASEILFHLGSWASIYIF